MMKKQPVRVSNVYYFDNPIFFFYSILYFQRFDISPNQLFNLFLSKSRFKPLGGLDYFII